MVLVVVVVLTLHDPALEVVVVIELVVLVVHDPSTGLGIQTREYDLLPDQDWMVDLGHMESLIDHNTAAIIVNSPSNPCGSVFSPAHLRQILDIAERHKVPIIGELN